MGIIQRGKDRVAMGSRLCVGRSPDCALSIEDRRVSGRHAEVFWTREGWQVRDLGSTNGTTLDGTRLDPGRDYPLKKGSGLSFGDERNRWELVDADPPQAMATATSGVRRAAEDGLLALPDHDNPEAVVFEDINGVWIAEVDGVPRTVTDQESLTLEEDTWRLCLPRVHEETLAQGESLSSLVSLHFEVSRDEEFTRIWLAEGGQRKEIPSRAHHYMLLLLARARLEDTEGGLTSGESGWLYSEDFCKMLGTEPHLLNVLVHRARQQFARLKVQGAPGLVERRRLTRQLRIGFDNLRVTPLL